MGVIDILERGDRPPLVCKNILAPIEIFSTMPPPTVERYNYELYELYRFFPSNYPYANFISAILNLEISAILLRILIDKIFRNTYSLVLESRAADTEKPKKAILRIAGVGMPFRRPASSKLR